MDSSLDSVQMAFPGSWWGIHLAVELSWQGFGVLPEKAYRDQMTV